MSELQPGMLALVIGARSCAENIGKIFEISEIDPIDSTALVVSHEILGFNKITGEKGFYGHAWIKINHLLPIRPESDPLHEKQQQELHA